jgi:hypothetical protein
LEVSRAVDDAFDADIRGALAKENEIAPVKRPTHLRTEFRA